jgi:hypothetical protein
MVKESESTDPAVELFARKVNVPEWEILSLSNVATPPNAFASFPDRVTVSPFGTLDVLMCRVTNSENEVTR